MCVATCYQIEYKASNPKLLKVIPNPKTDACNNAANKTAAENAAKAAGAMRAKREDVNNFTAEPGCACPPWHAVWNGGWAITQARLTFVHSHTVGNCTYTVILEYDREERKRSANCT
jgi:hypothetical protein